MGVKASTLGRSLDSFPGFTTSPRKWGKKSLNPETHVNQLELKPFEYSMCIHMVNEAFFEFFKYFVMKTI